MLLFEFPQKDIPKKLNLPIRQVMGRIQKAQLENLLTLGLGHQSGISLHTAVHVKVLCNACKQHADRHMQDALQKQNSL